MLSIFQPSVVILYALPAAPGAFIIPVTGAVSPPLVNTSSPIIVRDNTIDPGVNSVRGV
jgi:hypothetical protein